MIRLDHLPDYKNPPLHEVVLGVQFAPPREYQQIYAKDVWELFKKDFPEVKEVDALPPSFETFGQPKVKQSNIELRSGACHDRFWFLSNDGAELIQFQQDRLLHNWRKVKDGSNTYPRFEAILPKYKAELLKLKEYYSSNFSSSELKTNQCELTYVNRIALADTDQLLNKWVCMANIEGIEFEDVSITTRKQLMRDDGEPYGRLICVCNTAFDQKSNPIIELRLTVRGAPSEPSIEAALNFLLKGRDSIVHCFDEITTEFAHNQWGRQ